jgi:hypothetical protein
MCKEHTKRVKVVKRPSHMQIINKSRVENYELDYQK